MKFRQYLKLNEDHFSINDLVMTPNGKGMVVKIENEGDTKNEIYHVTVGDVVMKFNPSKLKAMEEIQVEKKPKG